MRHLLNNVFIIDIDEEYSEYVRNASGELILGVDGKPLKSYASEFNHTANRNRIAKVVEIPYRLDDRFSSCKVLKQDDLILLHVNAFVAENKQNNGYWKIDPEMILARVAGEELEPLGDRVFLDMVKNAETKVGSIYLPFAPEHIKQEGVVVWASVAAKAWGIVSGDVAFMNKDAYAQISFNDKTYYNVEKEMLFGKKVNDELIPYGYYTSIRPLPEKESLIWLPEKRKENTLRGVVEQVGVDTHEVNVGDTVVFFRLAYQGYGENLVVREDFVVYRELAAIPE